MSKPPPKPVKPVSVTVKLEFLTRQNEREVRYLQGGVGDRISFGTFERNSV